MRIISTALLAAGLVSLAACGGSNANNAAASNVVANDVPAVENLSDVNSLPPADLNATNSATTNASGNAAASNSSGNAL